MSFRFGDFILPELNIGIGLTGLNLPFRKALHTAAQLGATGVEIDVRNNLWAKEITDTGRRQLRKMLNDLNLRVAAVRFNTRRGYDVREDLERRVDATKDAMRLAYSLGTRVVINAVGYIAEQEDDPSRVQLGESLSDLARFGQHVGAMLACETGSEPAERLANLLDGLGEDAIGIAFNPGNLIVNDYYDENDIKSCVSRTLVVVARDGVRDLARGRGMQVPLGRGTADFPQILGVLEQSRYQGWFLLESTGSESALPELMNAVSYLKAL